MKRMMMISVLACTGLCGAAGWHVVPCADRDKAMLTTWGECVTPENAWRQYPRPQMERASWVNLNGLWQYTVTTNAAYGFPSAWEGEILVPFVLESSLSGVGRLLTPKDTLWYRRAFTVTAQKGMRTLLNFEQCDFRAQVFVNGVEAGVPHEGGQMPFSYDVTDLVKEGANELVVAVWDPTTEFIGSRGKQVFKPHGCMYTRTSGLGGTVWLETVPETHLTNYRVTADAYSGIVTVTLFGAGNLRAARGHVAVVRKGEVLLSKDLVEWGKPITFKLPQPVALWSPESPNLYDLEITLTDGRAKDVVKGYFGVRTFEMKKDDKGVLALWLNGKKRFPIGTLDQGWWPDGLLTPPSEEAMAFDITALKKSGFDMMRKHIKVEPRRYYYLCDTLGILVMQDMPSGGGDVQARYGFYRRELKEMVDHLGNHPSIVAWIPYNENWGQPDAFLTHATLMWVQRYDPTRVVDGPSGWHDYEGGSISVRVPGKGWTHTLTAHKAPHEEEAAHLVDKHDYSGTPKMFALNNRRASFLGEFGGIGCRVENHLWTTNAWGYGGTGGDRDRSAVQAKYVKLMEHVAGLAAQGLCGSVYTQTTDVEQEINGLFTYDRKVIKFDPKALSEAHEKIRAAVK